MSEDIVAELTCLMNKATDEIFRLRAKITSDRQEWKAHMKTLGPLLHAAREDGMLDTLIEANAWPLPACALTDDDIAKATEEARRIRPQIEAEQTPEREGDETWHTPR